MGSLEYPTELNYTCNATSACYNGGICAFNSRVNADICTCKLYYDPVTLCKSTLFEQIDTRILLSYSIVGLILCILSMLLFGLELIGDILILKKKAVHTFSFSVKIICIITCLLKIASLSLFTNGLMNNNPLLAPIENTIRTISTAVFYVAYIVCMMRWFEMALKIKTLGFETKNIKIFKIINIVVVSIFTPAFLLFNIMYQYNVIPNVSGLLSNISSFAMITIPMLINLVYSIKAFIIIHELIKTESNTGKITKLRNKTIILTVSNILLLVFICWGIYGSQRPRELIFVTLLRLIVGLGIELVILFIFWLFIQNYAIREHHEPFTIYFKMFSEDRENVFRTIISGTKQSTKSEMSDRTETKPTHNSSMSASAKSSPKTET